MKQKLAAFSLMATMMLGSTCWSQQDQVQTSEQQAEEAGQHQAYWNATLEWNQKAADAMARGEYASALESYQMLLSQGQNPVSPYWIGVQCESAGEVPILSDLPTIGRLFHKGGLKVNSVTQESPAQKSGIKAGDVIIAFNDQLVNDISELLVAVGEAETNEVDIQVVRVDTGKVDHLKIAAVKRPEEQKGQNSDQPAANLAWQQYWLAQQADPRSSAAATYWLAAVNAYNQLPEDVEVTWKRKGKQPIRITVQRGDKTWSVETDQDVNKLPQDVQPYVRGLRSNSAYGSIYPGTYNLNQRWNQGLTLWNARNYAAGVGKAMSLQDVKDVSKAQLLKQIKELSEQLKSLQESVDRLNDE